MTGLAVPCGEMPVGFRPVAIGTRQGDVLRRRGVAGMAVRAAHSGLVLSSFPVYSLLGLGMTPGAVLPPGRRGWRRVDPVAAHTDGCCTENNYEPDPINPGPFPSASLFEVHAAFPFFGPPLIIEATIDYFSPEWYLFCRAMSRPVPCRPSVSDQDGFGSKSLIKTK